MFFFFLVHLLFNYFSKEEKQRRFISVACLNVEMMKTSFCFSAFVYQEIQAKIEGCAVFLT